MLKIINSTKNLIIKLIVQLKNKKDILQNNLCFVESEKIVLDLIKSNNINIKNLFIVKNKQDKFINIIKNFEDITYIITDEISKKISNTITPSGIFALVELPKQQDFDFDKNFLILDNLQDPSNLGAIIRSSVAFNIKQIVILNGVYPYLPKVIRSSMGYVFKINFKFLTVNELINSKKENHFKIISADLKGDNINDVKLQTPYGIVIGNEGNGISNEIKEITDKFVTIPMNNNVESLNASVSASIIMYKLNN